MIGINTLGGQHYGLPDDAPCTIDGDEAVAADLVTEFSRGVNAFAFLFTQNIKMGLDPEYEEPDEMSGLLIISGHAIESVWQAE